jgi:Fur family ferric uptake transcriptional regulator/Fur family peroxide stress response transcriptional regulator
MAKSPRMSEVDWKAAGLRKTRQRETVLLLVCSHCEHPTAEWIHNEARRKIPGISLATVYRTLRMLKEKGLLLEFSGGGYPSRYDVTPYDHEHIRCVACGAVSDVELPEGRDLRALVSERTHYRVSFYPLVFHGLCYECACARERMEAAKKNGRNGKKPQSAPPAREDDERFWPEGSW